MGRNLHNNIALFIICLFAIAPFFGFLTLKMTGRHFNTVIAILSSISIYYTFLIKGSLKLPTYIKIWSLFVLYTIISDLYIAHKSLKIIDILFYNNYFVCLYVIILIENIEIPDDFFQKLVKIITIVLFISFIVILIQQFASGSFFVNSRGEEIKEIDSEARFPSIYSWVGPSAYLGLAFFPLLSLIVCEALKVKSKYTWILFFIGAVVSFLNKSRFMMLNYLIIFALIPIYEKVKIGIVFKGLVIIVLVISVTLIGAKMINFDIEKIVNERILEKDSKSIMKTSAGTRIIAFQVFGQLFPKNPVFGKGMLHSFGREGSKDIDLIRAIHGRSSQIHVGYLSLFYYYGLIGGIIYLTFFYIIFKKLYKDAKLTNYWGVFIAWIMFFLTNWTGVTLSFINMGLILSLFVNRYYMSKLNQKLSV